MQDLEELTLAKYFKCSWVKTYLDMEEAEPGKEDREEVMDILDSNHFSEDRLVKEEDLLLNSDDYIYIY